MMLPVLLMIAALQFLCYELVAGVVNAALAQFVLAISLAFISGLFYPLSFFPDIIKNWAGLLPTGVALSYSTNYISGQAGNGELLCLLAYLAAFLCFGIIARKWRIKRETA
jgi:ABC-type multidrug transport system permease subunit